MAGASVLGAVGATNLSTSGAVNTGSITTLSGSTITAPGGQTITPTDSILLAVGATSLSTAGAVTIGTNLTVTGLTTYGSATGTDIVAASARITTLSVTDIRGVHGILTAAGVGSLSTAGSISIGGNLTLFYKGSATFTSGSNSVTVANSPAQADASYYPVVTANAFNPLLYGGLWTTNISGVSFDVRTGSNADAALKVNYIVVR